MYRNRIVLLTLCLFPILSFGLSPKKEKNEPVSSIQTIINSHYYDYHQLEYFSGIQVSIQIGDKLKHYTAGYRSHNKQTKVSAKDLFQIGSITKSYTAVLSLLAEQAGKIDLSKPIKTYLTAYPYWQDIHLTDLLNMTSGLPNYSEAAKINLGFSDNIKRYWNSSELIDLVYTKEFKPPLRSGYHYTNTGYILMDIILSEKGEKTYNQLLKEQIIQPLGLKNTFYPIPSSNAEVNKRLVSGYAFNVYDNPEIVGRDIRENNLSWAASAGGLVANSEDVVLWVNELFLKNTLLSKKQLSTLQKLNSIKSGKPIRRTTRRNPKGFGLGVIQKYDSRIGRFWYYEGKTLGFRALYMVVPCKKIIITALLNSATNDENDHSGQLMMALYEQTLKSNPKIKKCRS